ncbi:unnamed protein product [Alternaria alternata]|uniref:CID domain-containing protein n=2 Tax=Alternaria alternata complex TaxID=187734 RepID=A0A4Q4NSW5_ALTAL|nr:hypothetical protein B0T12DRAFT_404522 [Alternaria alternata]RYN31217.1 hypothetical protein AA0114_g12188 [Alternaria tenuissima]RYN81115.1 hypothetical protein AA0117_g2784 [Alternaria alternata]
MAPNDDVKRATSVLTIAQIKFKQAMKKTDTEDRLPIPVEVSSQLFSNIDAVLKQNTRVNIQKCTEWIVKHVAPSKARIAILGDYLIAVSKSIVVDQSAPGPAKKAARNRMDLLLIVNDVLHTDKFHRRNTIKQGIFSDECESFVVDLIEQGAVCITERASQLELKLRAIINYWTVNRLLSTESLKTCREKADEALLIAQGGMPVRKRNYLLPEFHGDRYAPWHDLPASYMLEQMIKYPKRPINPSKIQVQRLDKKPVSPHVRNLLDNFFEKIDLKYLPTGDNPTSETTKYKLSLDPMGQLVKQNKETGETVTVANGYGWSPKFCQDMQKFGVPENIKIAREDAERMEDMDDLPVTSVARRDDRHSRPTTSSSDSDYRRERMGYNRSRSRSYSRRSSGSYDDDRSPPRRRFREENQGRRRVSPSPSSKPTRRELEQRGLVESGRHSRAYDKDGSQPASQWNGPNRNSQGSPGNHQHHVPPMPPQNYGQPYSQPPQAPFNAPPFPPQHMPPFDVPPPPPPQFQGPGGFVPPPPPPNFNGAWVPPPPPPNFNGGWPHPLPPNMNMPPHGPQQSNPHGGQYGNQGGNQYGNQGGNQYGNNGQYGQNRGGYQGGRGYGGGQRGGNRGGWRGTGRGGRY